MWEGMDPREAREAGVELGRLVRETWARGWQPADLHRAYARHKDPVVPQVLGDVVAAEVARHASATVDDRWHAQLEEISARVWWDPGSDPLTARATRAKDGWTGVRRAVTVLSLSLRLLPQLELLGPLPGEATPRGGVDVDDAGGGGDHRGVPVDQVRGAVLLATKKHYRRGRSLQLLELTWQPHG